MHFLSLKKHNKVYWTILIICYSIILFEIFTIYQKWNVTEVVFYLCHMVLFVLWLIILRDMIRNRLFNKAFWILSMFILPPICLPSYLWLRERLLR